MLGHGDPAHAGLQAPYSTGPSSQHASPNLPLSVGQAPSPPTLSPPLRDSGDKSDRPRSPEVKRKPSQRGGPPLARLENLIQTIASTLRSYAALPTQSTAHIAALRDFHSRALALQPRSQAPLPSHHGDGWQTQKSQRLADVDIARMEALENEWWTSEIAAAWFGPTRRAKPTHKAGVSSRKRGPTFGLDREASYVGLNDE